MRSAARVSWTAILALAACGTPGSPGVQTDSPDASGKEGLAPASAPSSPSRDLVASLQKRERRLEPSVAMAVTEPRKTAVLPASEAESIARTGDAFSPRLAHEPSQGRVSVSWPALADQPFTVAHDESSSRVQIKLLGSRPVEAEVVDGYLVYRGAMDGASLVQRPVVDGTEDYVAFERRPAKQQVDYEVELSAGIAGLRLVGGTFEMLDAKGTPRLRMSPPYLVGADGATHDARVSVLGCAVDTNPAAPWGRTPVKPGASHCVVRVSWDGDAVQWPAVLDPSWTATGMMITARHLYGMVMLKTGKVLAAGGEYVYSGASELYDPASGTWAATGSMTQVRHKFTLSGLGDGRAIAAGGWVTNISTFTATTEFYDSASGTWTASGNLVTARQDHDAQVLGDGRVLVFGGYNGGYLNSAELFDPTTNTWSAAPAMATPRSEAASSMLLNGKVLVTGGNQGSIVLSAAEAYDAATNTWAPAGTMPALRTRHVQGTLPNGKVVVAGGYSGEPLYSGALYDPAANSWAATPSMNGAREAPAAAIVQGKLLVAGGRYTSYSSSYYTAGAELFDPQKADFLTTTSMIAGRYQFKAQLLPSGKVLVAGGYGSSGSLKTAELYTAAVTCTNASECSSGFCVDGYCCDTMCAEGCDRCDVEAREGTCTAIAIGSPGVDPLCAPYLCNGSAKSCPTTCTQDSNCIKDYYCGAGQCLPRKQLGTDCSATNECLSFRCADGVCCDATCNGSCDTCKASMGATADGKCTALTGPGSPACSPFLCDGKQFSCPTACVDDSSCISGYYCTSAKKCEPKKQNGSYCAGNGECAYGHCVEGVCCDSVCDQPCDSCKVDIYGTCKVMTKGQASTSCNPYRCDGVSASCATTCTADADCWAAYKCEAGACVPKAVLGTPCTAATECASNYCADGYCCDSSCAGECNACSVALGAAENGKCVPIKGAGNPACTAPYACNGSTSYCPSSCYDDSYCITGYACTSNKCVAKLADGAACTLGSKCLSGICADGVCCDKACTGQCESCVVSGGATKNGECTATPGPGSPSCAPYVCGAVGGACPAVCTADSECVAGAACIDSQCKLKVQNGSACTVGAECISGNCADGFCCNTACGAGGCDRCDLPGKKGVCTIALKGDPGASPACSPYACDGVSGACPTTCVVDTDCTTGLACKNGLCAGKSELGKPCSNGGECNSGACADGVCCNTVCNGGCDRCNLPSSVGTCTVAVGGDPGANPGCAPYICNGVSGVCPAACASHAECITGLCDNGACVPKLAQGEFCNANKQCTSGSCADGVCCDKACGGQCEACDLQGSKGTCSAVTGAPVGGRPACNGTVVACAGTCDGSKTDACSYPIAGVECQAASCDNQTAAAAAKCDGNGTCIPGATTDCGSAGCAGNVCAGPDGGPEEAGIDADLPDAQEQDATPDAQQDDAAEDVQTADGDQTDSNSDDAAPDGDTMDAANDAQKDDAEAGKDAEAGIDAAKDAEAGIEAGKDATTTDASDGGSKDAAASKDAKADSQAQADADPGTAEPLPTGDTGGCGCRVESRPSRGPAAALLGLALLALARMKRRPSRER